MIKETSTCSYLMIIDTPRLCNDVAFLPPQENLAHPISCQPVLSDSEVDAWALAQVQEKLRETERLMALAEEENPLRAMSPEGEGKSPKRAIVGGVEVGAHKQVGGEGRVIEKSVVVDWGKETKLATIATSDGMTMSPQELKKYSINDPNDVEKLKKTLEEQAKGLGWKLELVQTQRGREFRGIIEAEEDETEVKKEQKENKKEEKQTGMKNQAAKDGSEETGALGSGKKNGKEDGKEEKSERGSEEVYKDEL